MGANAVTTVPVYVAGEVLTAADLNITNSGIPVFASTVERDAAFGGTGEKTLAEGQYAYLESTKQTLVYDGSNWVTVGVSPGLVLIKTQTIGTTVGSVEVTGAFSATYDVYKITVTGGIASNAAGTNLKLTLGATATGYYSGQGRVAYSGATAGSDSDNNATSWTRVGNGDDNGLNANLELTSPFLSKVTTLYCMSAFQDTGATGAFIAGWLNNTTSYTAFTITPAIGTLTGGTIRVYGYANS